MRWIHQGKVSNAHVLTVCTEVCGNRLDESRIRTVHCWYSISTHDFVPVTGCVLFMKIPVLFQ